MPTNCAELQKVIYEKEYPAEMTLLKVREHNFPPLSRLVKDGDKTECYKFIKLVIVYLNQFYGVTWNDVQITETAKTLYGNHFYFSGADWVHFRNKCISGAYNNDKETKIYGFFSTQNIIQWAKIYDYDWQSCSEVYSIESHKQLKQSEGTISFAEMPEETKQALQRIEDRNKAKEKSLNEKLKANKEQQDLRRAKFNEFHQEYLDGKTSPEDALKKYNEFLESQTKK